MNVNINRIVCFILLTTAIKAYAQNTADSTRTQTPVNNAITYFKAGVDLSSGLYNGPEYVFYERKKDDNVFFQNSVFWELCTVKYDGTVYTDVPVMYDIFKDKVVVQLYNKAQNLALVTEKISDFFLLKHHFVYREADSLNEGGLRSALYDQIYGGRSEILVRRTKSLIIAPNQQKTYPQEDKLFIRNKGAYYAIGSKGSLLNALKDKKKELRKFIKDSGIDFKDRESASVQVAMYYDRLTQ